MDTMAWLWGVGTARPSPFHGPRRHARSRATNPLAGARGLALALLVSLAAAGCAINIGGAGSPTSVAGGTTIPVQVLKGQDNSTLVEIPVFINGHGPYPFILDTGASISLIETPLAQRFGLPVVTGSRQKVSGVGGSSQAVLVRMSNWRVGKVTLPTTSIARASAPNIQAGTGVDGLIGSDIWSTFGAITISYQSGTLTIYNAQSPSG
jgi:hypothetical protein